MLRALLLALACLPVPAPAQEPIAVAGRKDLAVPAPAAGAPAGLRLSLALLEDTGWEEEAIAGAVRDAAAILAQCGVALERAELVRVRAPGVFRDFLTPLSRKLAAAVPLARPAIWFVRDTRQRPAFDAEAIGRGNSRTRPELADTVWVTRATRDLGIALAHELAHVLMDSGEHSDEPGNLMREETSPASTALSANQCAQLRDTGTANGLLQAPERAGQGRR